MSDEPQQQSWAPRDPTATPPAGQGKKGKKAGRPKRTGWRRLFPTWRTLLGTFLFLALLVVGGFLAGYHYVHIPAANAAATAQSNVYLYADGTPLARDGDVNRENVQLAQVPRTVQRAVLAAEDRGFYNEPAVDPQGMVRAAWNTATGKGTQGGSTITQQYVKNYYLGQEQTVTRKAKEFFIAIKLNREESKEQILEGYLNTSYFGRNAYGIQAAAQAYYGKDIEDITTAEGAYLASLLNAPSEFDVVAHPENKPAAVARWNYVLDGMVKEHWLSPADRAAITFPTPGQVKNTDAGLSGQRGYIVQAVKDYLITNHVIDEKTLATGGYRITTTLERGKQNAFTQAVKDQVTSKLDPDRAADKNVRVGGASVDPATGKVVAMYGGIDYTKQYVNNATRRDYQVGSTFKPFVFASAVQNGSRTQDGETITPNTIYDGDNKRMVEGPDGPTGYAPANEDDVDYGPITVRTATDKSVNAVYAQMAEDVGPATVRKTAVSLGLPSRTPDLTASPSIALGPATASVLDMAEAYATLANHGRHGTYTLVDKVSKNGANIALPDQDPKRAISREAADTTTSMLRSVVSTGTGTAAGAAGRPAAGKTGTAEDDKAAWFAGYTPNLATVVSVMGADPETAKQKPLYGALGLARVNGGGPPAQIWGQYTAAALKGTPVANFDLQLEDGAENASPDPQTSDEPTDPADSQSPSDTQGGTDGPSQDGSRPPGQDQGQTGTPSDGGPSEEPTGGPTTGGTDGGTGTSTGTGTTGTAGDGPGGPDTGGGTADGGTDGGPGGPGGGTTGTTTGETDGGTGGTGDVPSFPGVGR
ncbi:transglycosylase domain-containing protein [Streptomyces liangshanensis]|uniref:Penicillin-binding protein n=1 Tax=Streptomyces liangshanensis TaxID=2717324 RepID=A0A6G9H338_9ACTN|nr:transglycosylase domain-containing protein [Streptomyces liangshanensis]QIQ04641.1 penicillin-binding protein [Streptomyces liangshanensis]